MDTINQWAFIDKKKVDPNSVGLWSLLHSYSDSSADWHSERDISASDSLTSFKTAQGVVIGTPGQ